MSLAEIGASLQSAKIDTPTCRHNVSRLTRVVGLTTTLAVFLITISVILITGALLCLTLPKVHVMRHIVGRIIIPSALGIIAAIPLILLSRKSNIELQFYYQHWVQNLLDIIQTNPPPADKKACIRYANEHLFAKTDGQHFNQELVKRIEKTGGYPEKDPFIKNLTEAVAKLYHVKDLGEEPDDPDSDDERKT